MPTPPAPPVPIPGAELSALDIIKSSLRLCHVLAAGESLDGESAKDALVVLNLMLDGWAAEKLMIFDIGIADFALVSGQQTYRLGPGEQFNAPRPPKIERTSVVIDNSGQPVEYPLTMVTDMEWQAIRLKTLAMTWPTHIYDDGAFPVRSLSFWPIPQEGTFRMYAWTALEQFPDLATKITFPPSYYEAIKYNLALRLVDEFSGELGPTIVAGAAASLARIKGFNSAPPPKLTCDYALGGGYRPIQLG